MEAIDGVALLVKSYSFGTVATYDAVPLEVEVGIDLAPEKRTPC